MLVQLLPKSPATPQRLPSAPSDASSESSSPALLLELSRLSLGAACDRLIWHPAGAFFVAFLASGVVAAFDCAAQPLLFVGPGGAAVAHLSIATCLGFTPKVTSCVWGAPALNQPTHSLFWGRHTLAFTSERGPLCLLRFATGSTVHGPINPAPRALALTYCGLALQRLCGGELEAAWAFMQRVPLPLERHQCLLLVCEELLRLPLSAPDLPEHDPSFSDLTFGSWAFEFGGFGVGEGCFEADEVCEVQQQQVPSLRDPLRALHGLLEAAWLEVSIAHE